MEKIRFLLRPTYKKIVAQSLLIVCLGLGVILLFLLDTQPASSEVTQNWQLMGDFEIFSEGPASDDIISIGGWLIYYIGFEKDPTDSSSIAMTMEGSGPYTDKEFYSDAADQYGIGPNDTGTAFYRIYRDGAINAFGGITFAAGDFNNYQVQFGSQGHVNPDQFAVRDGGSFKSGGEFIENAWHCVWLVADEATNTFEVYVQGGRYQSQTRLTLGGTSTFNFRNGDRNDTPTTVGFMSGGGTSGKVYFDDVYINPGQADLSNPGVSCPYVAPTPPSAPSLFSISNSDQDGSYTVDWSSVSGADQYTLLESFNGAAWDQVYNGTSTQQSYSGKGDGQWCYAVQAENDGGTSPWSSTQCTTVDTTVSPPSAPSLSAISNSGQGSSYTVDWSSSTGADQYILQEQFNSGSWSQIYNGSSTERSLSGKSDGEWCYRVQAENSGGSSGWSTTRCTTVDTVVVPPPTPIIDAIANSEQAASYTVTWSAVTGADVYELQESLNGGSWSPVYIGSAFNHSAAGKANGEWCYRLQASNTGGGSGWSNSRCTTVDPVIPPANAVTVNTISNSDQDGSYSISWTLSSNASSYTLEEQKDGGSWSIIYSGIANQTNLTNRKFGEWCYRAQASNDGGSSAWSPSVCTSVVDSIPPTGAIQSPADGKIYRLGDVIEISASANDENGIKQVTAAAFYEGEWHQIGVDTTAPYLFSFTIPTSIADDEILIGIEVEDNAGNTILYAEESIKIEINRDPVNVFLPYYGLDEPCLTSEREPNNIRLQANRGWCMGIPIQGRIANSQDAFDIFEVDITTQKSLTIQLTNIPSGSNYDLWLTDELGNRLSIGNNPGSQSERISRAIETGTYYIAVVRVAGHNNAQFYQLTISD